MKNQVLKQTILTLIELISTTTDHKTLKELEAITFHFKNIIESGHNSINPEIGFELWIYAGLQSEDNIPMANQYKNQLLKMFK